MEAAAIFELLKLDGEDKKLLSVDAEDKLEGVLPTEELGAAKSKVVVDDEGEEGTELFIED